MKKRGPERPTRPREPESLSEKSLVEIERSERKSIMSKARFLVVIACLGAGGCAINPSMEVNTPEAALRTIAVTGTAETLLEPDEIVWSLSTTDENPNLAEAVAANEAKVAGILRRAREMGVADEDIQTGRLDFNRVYERDERGNVVRFQHFRVRRTISICQKDFARFGEFIDLIVAADAEASYDFRSTRRIEVLWETRLEAVRIARKKAEEMAANLGARIGSVLTVGEQGGPDPAGRLPQGSNYISNGAFFSPGAASESDASSGSVAPGSISIRNTVYVTFELRDARER